MEKRGDSSKKNRGLDYSYAGAGKKKNYFEGWYLKFQTAEDKTVALIPSLHVRNGRLRGNLQWVVSEGSRIITGNRSFKKEETRIEKSPFTLILGKNRFTEREVFVDEEGFSFEAAFKDILPYPRNIMGPFSVFQNLPCIHGLQAIKGEAGVKTRNLLFEGSFLGRMYSEKDRGTTFPERYIWFHADFPKEEVSVFFSTALIPLGPFRFNGYIANVHVNGENHTFATYKAGRMKIRREEKTGEIFLSLLNRKMKFVFRIKEGTAVSLDSPRDGEMEDRIRESMDTKIEMISIHGRTGEKKKYGTKRGAFEHCKWFKEKV